MDNPHDNRRYIAAQRDRSDEIWRMRHENIKLKVALALLLVFSAVFYVTCKAGAQTIDAKYLQAESYILSVNPCAKDSALAAKYLVDASNEAQLGWGWQLLAAISRYETGEKFNVDARNKKTRCFGLLQVAPCHADNMGAAGLDFTRSYDTVLFAAVILATSAAKGKTLYQALKPWSVRELAIKEYRRIR